MSNFIPKLSYIQVVPLACQLIRKVDIHHSFFFFFNLFIYLFMAVLGLRFWARASSRCGKRGPLFIAVRGPLTIAASLVVEHKLQMRRLSSCGSRAQLLCGMWDLPRPGLEPVITHFYDSRCAKLSWWLIQLEASVHNS